MIDGLVKWSYRLFKGGTSGQVWKKLSDAAYDMGWGSVDGTLPAGGTTGQVLAKVDGDDYNTEWATPSGGGASYLVYTALLTQSGTDAPVATVLENTLGTISFVRSNIGSYYASCSGLFTTNKTVFTFGVTDNFVDIVTITTESTQNTDSIFYFYADTKTLGLSDEVLLKTLIEIRVYP
jgi:hypothetical protein